MSACLDFVASPVSQSPRRRRASRRLWSAIHRNDWDLTQKALTQHADLGWVDPVTGWTPLELAALKCRPSLVSLVLSRMSPLQARMLRPRALDLLLEQWPRQPLQAGPARSTLDALLKDTSLSLEGSRHPWGWMGHAVDMDCPSLAFLLLEYGVLPALRGPHGQTLLHQAVEAEALEMVEWCLSQGLEANDVDEWGNTPLHIAAQSGNLALADRLIGSGGMVDKPNLEGGTPLDLAAESGRPGALWQAAVRHRHMEDCFAPAVPPLTLVRL